MTTTTLAPPQNSVATTKKLVLLSSLGGLLEFYDFIVYALFANIIAQVFFPTSNSVTSLLVTFMTFSMGYLARPLGGFFFGHFGDKFGRKKTFTTTIFIMAASTFLIGLVPSYNQIGILAPILLLVLRLLQGFSLGGEIPGAITYLSEWMPKRKGLICGFIFCALINGIVLGSLLHSTLLQSLTPAQILSWGWRVPFILGGILGTISYFLRKQFYESPLFQSLSKEAVKFPLKEVIKNNSRAFISGILFVSVGASMTALMFLFAPSYLTTLLKYPATLVFDSNTLGLFLGSIFVILFGWLADKISKHLIFTLTCVFSIGVSYLIFDLYVQHQVNLLIPMILSAVLQGLVWGTVPGILVEMFSTSIRYSGVAAAYNIGFAVFAGFAPIVALFLINTTKILQSPSFFLILTCLLGLLGMLILPKKKKI